MPPTQNPPDPLPCLPLSAQLSSPDGTNPHVWNSIVAVPSEGDWRSKSTVIRVHLPSTTFLKLPPTPTRTRIIPPNPRPPPAPPASSSPTPPPQKPPPLPPHMPPSPAPHPTAPPLPELPQKRPTQPRHLPAHLLPHIQPRHMFQQRHLQIPLLHIPRLHIPHPTRRPQKRHQYLPRHLPRRRRKTPDSHPTRKNHSPSSQSCPADTHSPLLTP